MTTSSTTGIDAGTESSTASNGSEPTWPRVVLLAVFVLGLVLRLATAALPERLLLRIAVDDAFYYLRTAQELGLGNGSTFDGIHSTNGYHPLWLWVLTPFTSIFGPGADTVRALIVLQTAIAALSFVLLARLLLRWLPPLAVALGTAVWWLTPLSVLSSVSGVEASLACLMVVLLITVACRFVDAPSLGSAAVVGVITGLAFLTRTDTAFAAAAIAVWVLWQVRARPLRTVATQAGAAAVTALAVVLPWLVWNLATFGTIEQASTRARPMVMWQLATGDTSPQLAEGVTAATSYLLENWSVDLGWAPLLAVGALVAACWAWRRFGFPHGWTRQLLLLAMLLLGSGTLLAAFHSGVRLLSREYYFEWVRMAVGILVAAAVAGFAAAAVGSAPPEGRRETQRRADLGLCLLTVATAFLAASATVQHLRDPPFDWQLSMVDAGRWLEQHTEPDERIVSFNSGLIGYFSQRPVINLDGVINNASLAALEDEQLARFICDSGARWYVDFDPVVLGEYRSFLGDDASRLNLEPVTTIRGDGADAYHGSELTIFRVSCGPP